MATLQSVGTFLATRLHFPPPPAPHAVFTATGMIGPLIPTCPAATRRAGHVAPYRHQTRSTSYRPPKYNTRSKGRAARSDQSITRPPLLLLVHSTHHQDKPQTSTSLCLVKQSLLRKTVLTPFNAPITSSSRHPPTLAQLKTSKINFFSSNYAVFGSG